MTVYSHDCFDVHGDTLKRNNTIKEKSEEITECDFIDAKGIKGSGCNGQIIGID